MPRMGTDRKARWQRPERISRRARRGGEESAQRRRPLRESGLSHPSHPSDRSDIPAPPLVMLSLSKHLSGQPAPTLPSAPSRRPAPEIGSHAEHTEAERRARREENGPRIRRMRRRSRRGSRGSRGKAENQVTTDGHGCNRVGRAYMHAESVGGAGGPAASLAERHPAPCPDPPRRRRGSHSRCHTAGVRSFFFPFRPDAGAAARHAVARARGYVSALAHGFSGVAWVPLPYLCQSV